ncbi:MAG TPA: caspase family protein, partial [Myxococcaceae bacterium]|nr:caspase family protein [Myxococcaceae bacterium]
GRSALNFAHRDAQSVADVLVQVGGFAQEEVSVLLDPEPDAVLERLDQSAAALKERGGESVLFFYYSGHADERALYPNGHPLDLEALRSRLEDPAMTVRVGVIDACRGGAWTRAKGLTPEEPFAVNLPLSVSSEGSVLIASSSGLESAHEADSIQGSYFTHHLLAGMRGAADATGDGQVTVGEAFAYAQRLTVRDTALQSPETQHPSYSMNLRGRGDFTLSTLPRGGTELSIQQNRGPLQLIQMPSGLNILELPEGKLRARVAVPSGRYLVRRVEGTRVYGREVSVEPRKSLSMNEDSLARIDEAKLASKGGPPPRRVLATTLADRDFMVRFGVGTVSISVGGAEVGSDFDWAGELAYGITDRLEWKPLVPFLAYRWGTAGEREYILAGGLTGLGFEHREGLGSRFSYEPTARFTFRQHLSSEVVLNASFRLESYGAFGTEAVRKSPDTWASLLAFGTSLTFGPFTLNPSIGWARSVLVNGRWPGKVDGVDEGQDTVAIGSILSYGVRSLPFFQWHLSPSFALEAFASTGWTPSTDTWLKTGTLGFSWVF